MAINKIWKLKNKTKIWLPTKNQLCVALQLIVLTILDETRRYYTKYCCIMSFVKLVKLGSLGYVGNLELELSSHVDGYISQM